MGLIPITPARRRAGHGRHPAHATPAPPRRALVAALVVGLSLTQDGAPPEPLLQLGAAPGETGFGSHLSLPGDLDQDGHADLLLGSPQLSPTPGAGAGRVRAVALTDGRVIFDAEGSSPGEAFGAAAARVGDWDGDGWDDLVVGAPRHDELAANGGQLQLRSGRDGRLLGPPPPPSAPGRPPNALQAVVHSGEEPFGGLGTCVVSLPDLDGDGLADVAATGPSHPSLGESAGGLWVLSTKELTPLVEVWGDDPDELFGTSLVTVPDLDEDGVPELAVGAPGSVVRNRVAGRIAIVSPTSGQVLLQVSGEEGERFGTSLAAAPGLGAEGGPALLVGAPGGSAEGMDTGTAVLIDLVTGKRLLTLHGAAAHDQLGHAVAFPGDFDGDGTPDLAAGAHGADVGGFGAGTLWVWSGDDGRVLLELHGERAGLHLGAALAAPGDVDGDGHDDLVVGCLGGLTRADPPGSVRVIPGREAPPPRKKGKRKR